MSLKTWFENKISAGNIIEIILLLIALVWLVAFMRSDINMNRVWNQQQDEAIETTRQTLKETYMRKDVAGEQFKAIRDQLDRIEKKID